MKRILISGANPYNVNKGVVALAVSSIFLFHRILSNKEEAFEICVYNHEFKQELDSICFPEGEVVRFRNIFPTDIFSFSGFLKTIFSKSRLYYLKEFLKCDYVFNISAGDGFSDIYGANVFISLSRINKLCRVFHKPYYLLPQTYGPFFSPYALASAKKECLSAGLLMSRDKESTDLLKNVFGCTNILDTIDVAFSLPYRKMKKEKGNGSIHIGINISETLCNQQESHLFTVSKDYLPIMKRVILQLLSDGYKVHLIPHVASLNDTSHNEYYIHYRLWEELQHPGLIPPPFFLSACDAKSYISSMNLFIGSRMHACIAAFSTNVPVLLLGYSRKFTGLFRDTLDYHYLIDVAGDFSVDNVVNQIREMISQRTEIENAIHERNQTIVKEKTEQILLALSSILQ